jgi:thiol-disulfide isomerase/thioredoxin
VPVTHRFRIMTLPALGCVLALTGACLFARAEAPSASTKDDVKLVSLKYPAFQAMLAETKAKGFKYTLVDAWASNCGPCKENFPHLIEMHKRFGPKGLRVVSLSLDDISVPKDLDSARQFLREKKVEFTNVLLDEDFGVGFEKLDITAIPAVFLYGPDGKEVKRFTMEDVNNQFTYAQVEEDLTKRLGGK